MNSLELQQSFGDARALRVVIVPVGDISDEKFKEYSDLVKEFSVVELASITRAPNETSPFVNLNWQDSKVTLHCVDRKAHMSDWEEFQVYRKTLGVIGIIHCQCSPDLATTYSEFEQTLQQYPTAAASVCFAFDPMVDQPDLERGNLVMIPNGDRKHLLFYLHTLLIDFAHTLIKHLERMLITDQSAYISTPLDPCKSWDEISRLKRRKTARLTKCKGDICLLAGSPMDAILYYNLSLEQLKSNNDWEWVAGCLEGYCSALYAIKQMGIPINFDLISGPEQNPARGDQEVIEKCTEAIGHYNRRKAVNLELELTLKLARFYASLDRKQEASDLLMTAFDIGSDFSTQEKITLACSIALMCKTMGFRRKFAFFIREAALLYHKIYNLNMAHYLLTLAAKYYQLEDLDPHIQLDLVDETSSKSTPLQMKNRNASRTVKLSNPKPINNKKRGWNYVQRVILLELVATSKAINDPLSTCKYILHLLRSQHVHLPSFKQQDMSQDLFYFAKLLHAPLSTNSNMNVMGFPFLTKFTPLGLAAHLAPIPKQSDVLVPQLKPTFIYTPFSKTEKARIGLTWVQGEMAEVKVVLSNPLAFEVHVQSISLTTSGVLFESYPLSLRVPPNTHHYEVVLVGTPRATGNLVLRGVLVKAFHLLTEHPVGPNGIAITLKDAKETAENEQSEQQQQPALGKSVGTELEDVITRIAVVPPLPLLTVRYPFHGSALSLFVGESHTTFVEMENSCTQPVDFITITLSELRQDKVVYNAAEEEEMEDGLSVFRWDQEYLQQNLPLNPGQRLRLPVHVYAKAKSPGALLTINYGRASAPNSRRCGLPFALHIQQGPRIASIDIQHASSRFLGPMKPFLIHSTPLNPLPDSFLTQSTTPNNKNLENNIDLQKNHFNSVGYTTSSDGNGNNNFYNNHSNNNHPNNNNNHTNNNTTTNNNNNNHTNNINNHTNNINNNNTTIDDVSRAKNIDDDDENDIALLVLDIENSSPQLFVISCYVDDGNLKEGSGSRGTPISEQKLVAAPSSTQRAILPIKRVWFSDKHVPPLKQSKKQFVKPKKQMTEAEERTQRHIQYYKTVLAKRVRITWASADHTHGIVDLHGLQLQGLHIAKLRKDALSIRFQPAVHYPIKIGTYEEIKLIITNHTTIPLTKVVLHIQPSADGPHSSRLALARRLAWVGQLQVNIAELLPQSTYEHKFIVCGLEAGAYKIVSTCETPDTSDGFALVALSLSVVV